MSPPSLQFDPQAEGMLGPTLEAKRLAYVLGKTAALHDMVDQTFIADRVLERSPVLDEDEAEGDREQREILAETMLFGLREYCVGRKPKRRKPDVDFANPIKKLLARIIELSPSAAHLLQRAFDDRDRLMTECVVNVPGLRPAYELSKRDKDDDPYDALARTIGYDDPRPRTPSFPGLLDETARTVDRLRDEPWSNSLEENARTTIRRVETALHLLIRSTHGRFLRQPVSGAPGDLAGRRNWADSWRKRRERKRISRTRIRLRTPRFSGCRTVHWISLLTTQCSMSSGWRETRSTRTGQSSGT